MRFSHGSRCIDLGEGDRDGSDAPARASPVHHPVASARVDLQTKSLEIGIDDALLLRLGRLVVLWGYVQMLLGRLLAQLCGAEAGALQCVAGDLTGETLT